MSGTREPRRAHVGLHARRLTHHPTEERFARVWQRQNDRYGTLAHLLSPPINEADPPNWNKVSERDQQVAATVVQWLGTPAGQEFLRAVSEGDK